MKPITFFDIEIDPRSKKILDIGSVKSDGAIFHSKLVNDFVEIIDNGDFICGHNIIKHDLKYLQKYLSAQRKNNLKYIDTLYLSPLLFPNRPYHNLLKDDKIQTDELNNPVNDSRKAKDLFYDEVSAFNNLSESLKQIYYLLLKEHKEFYYFFEYISYSYSEDGFLIKLINEYFENKFCSNTSIETFVYNNPKELAYCLALISSTDRYSITPPWVLKNYPEVESIMYLLRNKPCIEGCKYCDEALNAKKGLKEFFGFDSYRTFNDEPLQENAVNAAINNKSLLAVFPTGGGKSLTFQIPALMAGRNTKGLTVIISPLQSLMKDQVDNLEKNGITEAVTINGLLDPIERAKSFERVEDGFASILYISPESLRSKTIERLLLGRNIVRFVIDEAHCFSAWGQDFRVDYLYIGDFIKQLQEKKNLLDPIPVSCFTATAKQNVVSDICQYFEDKLSLQLEVFRANSARTNLQYKVYNSANEDDKYNNTRRLIESKNCPTIIYVSRTRKAYDLADRLSKDGFNAKPYHGKMEVNEKTENQNNFIAGNIQVMVATSAFGMGVDKKDVGMVIHYDISDSLENYVQEAGRAGRDENISADCFVLYNEEDLNKHFILLNQTKLSVKEIQQIWRAIKHITKFRSRISNSALEIARKAGWDDNVVEIETRVKTAIAALEHAGYLKRGQNIPRIFANSIVSKNAQQAIEKINRSSRFNEKQKVGAVRIIKKLFSSKSKKYSNDEVAEARIDYISDHLGIVKEEVIKIITLLREEKILADTKDLTAFIKKDDNINRSLSILKSYAKIERFLLQAIEEFEKVFNLKELNEGALEDNCLDVNPNKIKTILNFWAIKNWIKRRNQNYSNNYISIICNQPKDALHNKLEKRHSLSEFIIKYLFDKIQDTQKEEKASLKEVLVEFSVHELRDNYKSTSLIFKVDVSIEDIEDALFYLSRIEAVKIEGGFLVVYNGLTIDRLEQNNQIQYKKDDYSQLEQFYDNKMQQIHIVGEYAKKMLVDYEEALGFVEDYFQLNYSSFLNKYFPGSRKNELKRNITPKKFNQLFGELSPRQLSIINDNLKQYIMVAAGPGSGKTRVLVHKLASLLLMEDVKHEQLLMLTFSRAATTEFKKRLIKLIGNAANFIEIKTFHSYCFDLLGRVGTLEKSDKIIQLTIDRVKNGDVEPNRIVKSVLVIDEAQDMDEHEFKLIKLLMEKNDEMRIVAVGDDDQNIYTFRGSDSKYFEQFIKEKSAAKYELLENYRSKRNLVEFTNSYVRQIHHRLKTAEVVSVQNDNGNIRIVKYTNPNFIVPFVNEILSSDLSGTTGVLTKSNEEALKITGLLLKNGIPAKLIQSNDGFSLYDLQEIRSFIDDLGQNSIPTISIEVWNNAKRKFAKKYRKTSNYNICKQILVDFQETNPKVKYRSDLKVFIKESKLEDFIKQKGETVIVSTIHKAKGKEFDNVFLMLDDFNANTDDAKRQLYVAMTRAKQNLTIHYNGNYFNNINVENIHRVKNENYHSLPSHLVYNLSHRDINLGYFAFIQRRLNMLLSGDSLKINELGLINSNNEQVVKFSKSFQSERKSLEKQGYHLIESKIRFILLWSYKNENNDEEREIKIVLPELCFAKQNTMNNHANK
jgi:ATP-dependent DNA helicase RecQ